MRVLSIDIETFSSNDLLKGGVYKYVEALDFEILLFAWSVDYGPVQLTDLTAGETLPVHVWEALTDPAVLKTAFNAQFERLCISKHYGIELPVEQWECTMVKAAMLSLPLSLKAVGAALKLKQQKDASGSALIKFFSIPCTPTARNGGRRRNFPLHDFVKWQEFKEYCVKDVEAENAIRKKLEPFDFPEKEKELYYLDQKINDTGIRLDLELVLNAIGISDNISAALMEQARELTGLDNPNSDAQLKSWIALTDGTEVESLNKAAMPDVREAVSCNTVQKVLDIRDQLSKSSVKKYQAMRDCVTGDGRAHGLLQFHGASRTGRWSGRLIQVQNLPRIYERSIATARDVVKHGDGELLHLLYGNVPDILSQLIRTAFIPSPGCRFIVADFSAIELIVIAWLAGEQWVIDEYKGARKTYEMTASRMLGIPVELIDKDSPERQKGKIASLACQYQGGVGALISMGALNMGLTEDELPEIVSRWRTANPAIVELWSDMENAAIEAMDRPGNICSATHRISFIKKGSILYMQLPSGRLLAYHNAALRPGKFGRQSISYYGMNQTTKRWELTDTYGGKLAENCVQAIARDLLAEALLRLDKAGYRIAAHVHDEVILDVPEDFGSLKNVIDLMTTIPSWAAGLPLAADGFEAEYYKK